MTTTDFLVIGSGIAGLTTALSLSQHGHVIIITKSREEACNSYRAQGGIAAAIGVGDSPKLHLDDTLRTAVGHADPVSADLLVRMGPATISLLAEWGTPFDQEEGQFALAKEGSHSKARILHVTGDATGKGITETLLNQAREHENITLVSHSMVADLLVQDGECLGAVAVDQHQGTTCYIARYGVVLAAGGCGQVFQYTTNDLVSTGDGLAMAYRAGAQLTDMEFIQFHPTALNVAQNPMFLISEAVRGEGAFLVTENGEPFMKRYSDWGDLAPRDVVSRAIYEEMSQGHQVFLDARCLGDRFSERFPTITAACKLAGIDPINDLIPVTPAAHFIMGGVKTDIFGQTTISRLFACGEVAYTGVHGANRLASNSLLEGAVFARRVADKLATLPVHTKKPAFSLLTLCEDKQEQEVWKQKIRNIMWEYAGIVRTYSGLIQGLEQLRNLEQQISPQAIECQNMLQVAQMIVRAAIWREESRGGHYRSDFPQTMENWARKQFMVEEKRL